MFKTLLAIGLMSCAAFSAETFTEKSFRPFFEQVKKAKYEEGITVLVKGTVLAEKVLGVKQTKENWIDQFKTIKNAYGNYQSFEKIHEVNVGKITKVYYLMYCESYAIKVEVALYNRNDKSELINFDFNDKIIDFVDEMNMLKRFTGAASSP